MASPNCPLWRLPKSAYSLIGRQRLSADGYYAYTYEDAVASVDADAAGAAVKDGESQTDPSMCAAPKRAPAWQQEGLLDKDSRFIV